MELNSATEISTDSEFERDPVTPQFADDNKKAVNRIQVQFFPFLLFNFNKERDLQWTLFLLLPGEAGHHRQQRSSSCFAECHCAEAETNSFGI